MDLQTFDHNLHQSDASHTLDSDLNTSLDLPNHQDLLSDPNLEVHHEPFDPSSIGIYEPNQIHNAFDNNGLADYQPHHANGLLDEQPFHLDHSSDLPHAPDSQHLADSYSDFNGMDQSQAADQHLQSFDHGHFVTDPHFDHLLQRSGTANFTPSSSADISKNKEVTFKDSDGNEQHGTVTDTHSGDTYKIQTSDTTYDNVAYHDIQKYGSK